MRSILSAERASRNCIRISQDSIYHISTSSRLGQRPAQQARIFSSSSCTRGTSPFHLPPQNSRRRTFSSMSEQSAQLPAQEALKAVEPQCPKETGSGKAEASSSTDSKSEPALPPLSGHEFKQYNRLAEHMNYFVSWLLFLPSSSTVLSKYVSKSRSSTNTSARRGICCTPRPRPVAGQPA